MVDALEEILGEGGGVFGGVEIVLEVIEGGAAADGGVDFGGGVRQVDGKLNGIMFREGLFESLMS